MSLKTRRAGSPWRGGLTAVLAAACLFASAAPASASSGDFCPAGGGTITIAANSSCTNTTYSAITQVDYYSLGGWYHCASSNSAAAGNGLTLIAAACGYGAPVTGKVETGFYALGVYSYARGTNDEPAAHSGYYGTRHWTP